MSDRLHVDLFSGLGGFSIAARANGIRTVQFCEIDARCRAFLAKSWPGVAIHDDVRTFHWGVADAERRGRTSRREGRKQGSHTETSIGASPVVTIRNDVYLLTAGVPCQPASRAGKQRGAADDRWLWPEAVRVLGEVRPAWACFENPPGIGDVGLAGILADVEAQGYAVRVFSIPACAVGAPHRRERYWIVCKRMGNSTEDGRQERTHLHGRNDGDGSGEGSDAGDLADHAPRGQRADGGAPRSAGHADQRDQGGVGNAELHGRDGTKNAGISGEGEGGMREYQGPAWGSSVWLPCADGKVRRAPDDSFGLVDGIHRSLLGALGNSIVPQVAAEVIRAIVESEE